MKVKIKNVWHLICYIKNSGVNVFSVLFWGQDLNTKLGKIIIQNLGSYCEEDWRQEVVLVNVLMGAT